MTPHKPEAQSANPVNPDQPALVRKPLSRRVSIVGSLVALLLMAGLGGLAWYLTKPATPSAVTSGSGGGTSSGGPGGRGGASTVGVATAEKASVPVVIDALGTVTPQVTVKVRPLVSGTLEKVLFSEGQVVRAGQILAIIDSRQFELALMQASGQLQRDTAQLESAKVTLKRFQTLLEQDSIARQDVDTQTALVKQLEGTVMVDKANEGVAKLNLSYTRLTAPISGRVGLRTVDVGNVVNPSDANGVALITQLAPIDVVFAVPQDRVGDLQKTSGADAIKVTAMDRTRVAVLESGSFASLDNQIDTTTGTVRAKARFANAQGALFPNQFVNIQVLVKTTDNAVVVPVSALRQGSAGDYVYVLNADRTVSLRPVTRGQATVEKVVVAAGLQAGERVITEGADRLKDGSRVSLAGDVPRGPRGGASGSASPGSKRQGPEVSPGAASEAVSPAASTSGAALPYAAAQTRKLGRAEDPVGKAAAPPTAAASGVSNAVTAQATSDLPTPEQRQRMLDRAKDDPEQLAQRKRFLEQLDKRDPEAIERWRAIQARRPGGGGGERPAQ